MNKTSLALSLLALALAVAYVEVRRPAESAAPPPAEKVDLSPVTAGLDRLAGRLEDLDARLQAVEVHLEERARRAPAAASPAAAATSAERKEPIRPEAIARAKEILAGLKDGRIDEAMVNELWSVLLGSGLEAEAIAAFTAYVKEHPEDPEGWYGLGVANIQKLRSTQNQLEIMKLSAAGDRAFDQALKLDDHHFGARFSKAFSYTFWPPFLGKGPEAIRHFEILVERHGNERDNDAMPIVFQSLGSEYLKLGNREKAREAFFRGLETFPDSKILKAQLEAMGE